MAWELCTAPKGTVHFSHFTACASCGWFLVCIAKIGGVKIPNARVLLVLLAKLFERFEHVKTQLFQWKKLGIFHGSPVANTSTKDMLRVVLNLLVVCIATFLEQPEQPLECFIIRTLGKNFAHILEWVLGHVPCQADTGLNWSGNHGLVKVARLLVMCLDHFNDHFISRNSPARFWFWAFEQRLMQTLAAPAEAAGPARKLWGKTCTTQARARLTTEAVTQKPGRGDGISPVPDRRGYGGQR